MRKETHLSPRVVVLAVPMIHTGQAARCVADEAALVLHALGGQQHLGDEYVQQTGQRQRDHVEHDDVCEEVDEVVGAGQLEVAGLAVGVDLPRLCEEQPRRGVDHREYPHVDENLPGSVQGADPVGQHGLADGDVALHGECYQVQTGGIDAQVLQEDRQLAPVVSPQPRVLFLIVADQLVGDRCDQHHEVRDGQADQVAVGGCAHALDLVYHRDHHDVAQETHYKYDALKDGAYDPVLHREHFLHNGFIAAHPLQVQDIGQVYDTVRQVQLMVKVEEIQSLIHAHVGI